MKPRLETVGLVAVLVICAPLVLSLPGQAAEETEAPYLSVSYQEANSTDSLGRCDSATQICDTGEYQIRLTQDSLPGEPTVPVKPKPTDTIHVENPPVEVPTSVDLETMDLPSEADLLAAGTEAQDAAYEQRVSASTTLTDITKWGLDSTVSSSAGFHASCSGGYTNGWVATSRLEACRAFKMTSELATWHAGVPVVIGTSTWRVSAFIKGRPAGDVGTAIHVRRLPALETGRGGPWPYGISLQFGQSTLKNMVQDDVNGWSLSGTASINMKRAQIAFMKGKWEIHLNHALSHKEDLIVPTSAKTSRCDTVYKAKRCVFNTFPGYLWHSNTAVDITGYRTHLKNARASGLRGFYINTFQSRYLTRMTDKAQTRANRNRSCPGTLVRPTGYDCDEYPFASTHEGALSGGGSARTFAGCKLSDPAGTGSKGFSRCMILLGHNRRGGAQLGAFYVRERMLNTDPFTLWFR